ncbi:unnamed protein product [Sphagnum troendelagicum]|uniref:RRM domain-containing protein n=1 Tax=Sphagnum troendelagicum TaxID=128251 RepID=A0ABP0U9M1_9BRYO
MRRRSPSYSPPRRRRSPSPRGRGGYNRGVDLPTSLLVRNIPRDCRPEDLRIPFERYGVIKDVYLPKDYYTGELRGFGFVQFLEAGDAAEAQYNLDHQVIGGREVTVVFAEENRKKPQEMRSKERIRSYTPDREYRHSYSPSPAPYQDVYSSPVRSNSRRRRDRSPPPTRRSPSPPHASRDYQLRSNDKDHYPDQYRRQQSSSHSPPSSRRQGREANYEGSPVSERRRLRHS